MAKVVIKNRAEPEWGPVIESKLEIMLGSMLAYTSRIDIELGRASQGKDECTTYTCKLLLVEDNGERYALYAEQPDGMLAIEGAIARARRDMVRRSRTTGWRQASVH